MFYTLLVACMTQLCFILSPGVCVELSKRNDAILYRGVCK